MSSEFMIPAFHDYSLESKIAKCGDLLYLQHWLKTDLYLLLLKLVYSFEIETIKFWQCGKNCAACVPIIGKLSERDSSGCCFLLMFACDERGLKSILKVQYTANISIFCCFDQIIIFDFRPEWAVKTVIFTLEILAV